MIMNRATRISCPVLRVSDVNFGVFQEGAAPLLIETRLLRAKDVHQRVAVMVCGGATLDSEFIPLSVRNVELCPAEMGQLRHLERGWRLLSEHVNGGDAARD
jgi:hypothetical protein